MKSFPIFFCFVLIITIFVTSHLLIFKQNYSIFLFMQSFKIRNVDPDRDWCLSNEAWHISKCNEDTTEANKYDSGEINKIPSSERIIKIFYKVKKGLYIP